jgi:peptidoglycan hydrolase-like protein with peptidoglycan-binding domain
VLSAQRALNRLGFGPVKADGFFGEETRAALERFERDRRITVTRDLSPRTLRELTAASGMRME